MINWKKKNYFLQIANGKFPLCLDTPLVFQLMTSSLAYQSIQHIRFSINRYWEINWRKISLQSEFFICHQNLFSLGQNTENPIQYTITSLGKIYLENTNPLFPEVLYSSITPLRYQETWLFGIILFLSFCLSFDFVWVLCFIPYCCCILK